MASSTKHNIAWNLSSNILPLLVGLALFPKIISAYGLERFGLLSLVWALIGYFSLFDLGLSRALTQQISEMIGKNKSGPEIAQLIRTAFIVMWVLGALGGMTLWVISTPLIVDFLKISGELQAESIYAFSLLALSIPLIVHTAALRAILEALHLFKSASLIRMILGIGTFLAPYLTSFISPTLTSAVVGLIVTRSLVWLLHIYAVHRSQILAFTSRRFDIIWLKPLLQFGGWMTVSNIIGPMMVYMDRFVLASILGAAATSFYVAPYEVVTKLLLVPAAIAGVLFPLFAKQWEQDPICSAAKLNQGICYTLILVFPAGVLISFFSTEWLQIWLGQAFAEQGGAIVTWLTIGILINSVAQILFAKVQGAKRSDWTAKLHLFELIPYLALLWACLNLWGIVGAAFAWCMRAAIDLMGLIYFSKKLNPLNWVSIKTPLCLLTVGSIVLLPSLSEISMSGRIFFVIILLGIYCIPTFTQLRKDKILGMFK
jgi:O-antigen/teichoic acid export membrane protein